MHRYQFSDQIKINPKRFYNFAQKRSKVRKGVGPLKKADGSLTKNDTEVANELNQTFQSAFTKPSEKDKIENPYEFFNQNNEENDLTDIEFTIEDVEKILKSLDKGKASGPDSFPADLLKECAEEIAPFMYTFIRKSIDTGEIPEIFKTSKITPLHKGGNKQLAANMRPVALTSHFVKVQERLMKLAIVNHLLKHNKLDPRQHGFLPQHSTLSQLLSHFEEIFLENISKSNHF